MAELSNNEQFITVLNLASRLIEQNKIQIRFMPAGRLRVIIDEANLKDSLAGSAIDEKTFREVFHGEIAPLLDAVIQEQVGRLLEEPSPLLEGVREDPGALKVRQATIRERATLVGTTLAKPDLRARQLVKASSKHPRLRGSSWEVGQKLALSSEARGPLSYPFVTLSLETIQPDLQSGILFWLFPDAVGRVDYTTFDCDEGDLNDLIQLLQDARNALHNARKES